MPTFAPTERRRITFLVLSFLMAVGMWLNVTPTGLAQSPSSWRTGPPLKLYLSEPTAVLWSQATLRRALTTFSQSHRVAVLLDRRVDPELLVEMNVSNTPIRRILEDLAREQGIGYCQFGPVAYFGPPEHVAVLRTLSQLRREEILATATSQGARLTRTSALRWDDFATPRELLAQVATEAEITIEGLEQIPHDLWAAADLPAISRSDQLTLLAGQFGLTFKVAADGGSVRLIPIPDSVTLVRSYPGGRRPETLVTKWTQLAPTSEFRVVKGRVYVKGPLEDHERIVNPPRPTPTASNSNGGARSWDLQRFTVGQTNIPLEPALRQVATQLQLTLHLDRQACEKAGIALDQLITFRVEQASVDELFEAMLEETGCRFRRKDSEIFITTEQQIPDIEHPTLKQPTTKQPAKQPATKK